MRATVSSRTKSGTNLHTSEGKDQVVRRRRRPSYQRAESVTFPVKNNSDYKSEHSISRSSCLAGLNMKSSADNETECSQETLEYVSKVNTFLEKSKSQRTQVRQTVPSIKKSGSQNSTKYSKVQEWLSRRNEPSISGYSNRNKRIQAIPILEKKQRSGPLKGGKPHQNVINCNQTETRLDVRNDELLISEVIIEKPQTTLKELFEHETSSDSSSPSDAISGHIVLETHDFSGESSIEDNASYTSSQHEMSYCSVDYCEGHCENMRNVGYQLSPSWSISGINSRERLGTFDSILELDFHDLRVPTDTSMKEYDNKDLDHHFQSSLELTRPSPLRLESQRALFMDKANQKDLTMQHDMSEKRTQIKGVSHGLNQKVQTLFTSALLGLGFYDLGFDSDFFYALML